jgi:AcrR family transcriptional regulator
MSINGTSAPIGLREQKKALTRATIESTALDRFLADGYEAVRLEDLCAECLVSTRTFFRYFTSKEDLVFGRLRSHLLLAEELLADRPAKEPVLMSLRAVIAAVAADYAAEPERELARRRGHSRPSTARRCRGRRIQGRPRHVGGRRCPLRSWRHHHGQPRRSQQGLVTAFDEAT